MVAVQPIEGANGHPGICWGHGDVVVYVGGEGYRIEEGMTIVDCVRGTERHSPMCPTSDAPRLWCDTMVSAETEDQHGQARKVPMSASGGLS